jgi:type II restriction/modification system DNA methylase subunit YeeA
MTPHEFIAKWRKGGDERRDAQPFFEDLCRLVGHPTPREADPEHTWFTYEYGASKTSGGEGWADVWKKGFFGWEAKGTHKSLERAYEQLKMYADALQNPPLLVVSDLQTIVIHTNFTNTVKREIRFTVDQLADFETRQTLEAVFKHPEALRPDVTRADITKEAAEKFADLAAVLRARGHATQEVAHFLNRLVFCMFAEDIGLLPEHVFTKLVTSSQSDPGLFEKRSRELFAAMSTGGDIAFLDIDWFNGGLFNDDVTLPLQPDELKLLKDACDLVWSEIDPSIFGTLFERGLDTNVRSKLGAHYTDPETIMKIVRPVIVEPWLREWKTEKAALVAVLDKTKTAKSIPKAAQNRFNAFLERLRAFTVLDPACGSGNFLFLALCALKDIEHRVLVEGEMLGLGRQFPAIGPSCVKGIELNAYAAELARITVWIGEIQWMVQNGYGAKKNPILQPLDQIECRDALLNADGSEAVWPLADVVIGNPPFIGGHVMRGELGHDYTDTVRKTFDGRVEGGADFVCFWFEKARAAIVEEKTKRAGLVSTNSIRGGSNRKVLDRVKNDLQITAAWSDQPWFDKGTAVRVSLIAFQRNHDSVGFLDGKVVGEITSSLTELVHHDISKAFSLPENKNKSFQGVIPRAEIKKKKKVELGLPDASFNLEGHVARQQLQLPANPKGEPISDVVVPYWIADDVTTRPLDRFIVNFGDRSESDASMFEQPFAAIENVRLHREQMEEGKDRRNWWQLARWRPAMLEQLRGLARYISIPRVAKHHICAWTPSSVVPDNALVVVAKDDDSTFGILQSHIHGIWSLRMGTSLEDRPRYTPTTCFETFPFPESLTPNLSASVYADDPRAQRIADAARALVEARDRWLNPPEWTDRIPEVVPGYPDRIVAKPGFGAELKKRTLTNLYNARPAWLDHLHRDLDVAVAAAYGWEWPMSDDEILRRLFELNQIRSAQ